MSLIGCRVGHACPWAPPVEISPNRTSARKELRRITFSSGGRAVVRLVRADYVVEAGSTQTGNLNWQPVDVMYGRPPLGKGFFGVSASGSGAVMYPAFVRGA
jgi:hypothetical protein